MAKTLPSTAVTIIEYLHERLGIVPPTVAGRPTSLDVNDDCAVILSTVLEVVKAVPDDLLRVTAEQRAQLLAATQDLAHTVGLLKSQDVVSRRSHGYPVLRPMQWLERVQPFVYNRYATEVIRDVLRQCPDEVVQPSTRDLPFIADTGLRESLRLDVSAVNIALTGGEYKAATVLGGSVVEALLLWGLSRKTSSDRQTFIGTATSGNHLARSPDPDPNKWDLNTFIEVAVAGNLIRQETAAIARIAKDFRNLIHPGRSNRLNQVCDRGTALAAISAVEHVITDFTNNPP
ncbi:MAG: hypothetical protein ACLQU1_15725 [Bryobacteraceae bacterium]